MSIRLVDIDVHCNDSVKTLHRTACENAVRGQARVSKHASDCWRELITSRCCCLLLPLHKEKHSNPRISTSCKDTNHHHLSLSAKSCKIHLHHLFAAAAHAIL